MEPRFDFAEVFDEDYLYFYEPVVGDEVSERQADLLWRLLELEPGMDVLDLACGHGRIANRLAERGCAVTGLDITPLFLERARRDAAARGVAVEYVKGDMRSLPWEERFDRILIWFTSFGYFSDEDNRKVLAEAHAALRPGGQLAIDVHNGHAFARNFLPVTVGERDGDLSVDIHELDVLTGRLETERVLVRGGNVRRVHFSVRFFTFTELRGWLLDAGFGDVSAFDHDGNVLSAQSRRMITVATR